MTGCDDEMTDQALRDARTSQRGAILAIVIITALLASLAAYAILIIARGAAARSNAISGKIRADYLAESGLVIATAKLRAQPDYPKTPALAGTTILTECSSPGVDAKASEVVNTVNAQGNSVPVSVDITVSNCGAGRQHKLTAKVQY